MKTLSTLLACLTIASFTMAAVAPIHSVDSRKASQVRVSDGEYAYSATGIVASKLADGQWLLYTNTGDYVLDFRGDVELSRGTNLLFWGNEDGSMNVNGEDLSVIVVGHFEIK